MTTSIAVDIAHRRATWAWQRVIATDPNIKYREMIKSLPSLINQSGLLATMAYLDTRTGSNKAAAQFAYQHLQDWLVQSEAERNRTLSGNVDFLAQLAAGTTLVHRQRTEECIAILAWLRRFADVAHPGDKT